MLSERRNAQLRDINQTIIFPSTRHTERKSSAIIFHPRASERRHFPHTEHTPSTSEPPEAFRRRGGSADWFRPQQRARCRVQTTEIRQSKLPRPGGSRSEPARGTTGQVERTIGAVCTEPGSRSSVQPPSAASGPVRGHHAEISPGALTTFHLRPFGERAVLNCLGPIRQGVVGRKSRKRSVPENVSELTEMETAH